MRRAFLIAPVLVASACGGEPLTEGLEEPIRVRDAQFHEGKLPGRRPLTAQEINDGKKPVNPTPTSAGVGARIVSQSETGISVEGRASPDTYAIGLAIEDQGSGYWVFPVGSPDPSNDDELVWSATFDLGPSIEPGVQTFLMAAIGANGNAGTQVSRPLCVTSPIPDNLNVCDPKIEPPAFVVSLGWSNDADLDLRIVEPNGSVIGSEAPAGKDGASLGRLDRDANSGCSRTGTIRENVVFQKKPAPGTYLVYVNLYDACGERAAPFTVSTHASEARRGGEFRQVETFRISGEALNLQANGGRQLGLFVTEFQVN